MGLPVAYNQRVVPNIQWKDIDDAVDRDVVVEWIDQSVPEWISESDSEKMKVWFND